MPAKLTNKIVDREPAPEKGSTTLWEIETKGFGARIFAPTARHPEGARSFFLSYRFNGVERRYTIGDRATWSVEAARIEAKELRKRIDRGEDITVVKRETRDAPTLQDLIDRYITEHLPRTAGATGKRATDEKKKLTEVGFLLGKHRKVVEVHGGDISEMHRKITEGYGEHEPRPVRANRILALCSKMFSLSLRPLPGEERPWRDAVMGNPCKGVERNPEIAKERFFSSAELSALADALAATPGASSDCIKLVMLTGCRPGEAMAATWEQFDIEPGFWVKPGATTKQRSVHKAPLNAAARELIEKLRADRHSKWAFPQRRDPNQHINEIDRAWAEACAKAGLKDVRPYDLRHSFASVGAGGGLSLQIIGKLLGHTQARTTQRYAHLADDPLREATEKVGAVISGAKTADVVQIKRGA
jgi:integrase